MTQAKSPARAVLQKFVVAVVALHVAAVGVYYAFGVPDMPSQKQRYFAWAWMAVTVAVVFAGLHRLRRARRGLP